MTLSHQLGFSEIKIKQFGAWSSNIHATYITTNAANEINESLTSYLADVTK